MLQLPRRSVLKATAGILGAAWLGGGTAMARSMIAAELAKSIGPAGKQLAVRFAHLTDLHAQPEQKAGEGIAACLTHIMARDAASKPSLIITGGDLIMDAFAQGEARTKLQWELLMGKFKDGTDLPVEHCLGNHDIWGWNKLKSGTTGQEKGWGKKYACDVLGMNKPYHSFDRSGWHFIVLDSVLPKGEGYTAGLDAEQFEWLASDLAAVAKTTPVCVVSHIPILGAGVMMVDGLVKENGMLVPAAVMFTNAYQMIELFRKHPNVKLCISGHIHIEERVDFQGVSYICDGAVSGAWWRGAKVDLEARRAKLKADAPPIQSRSDEGYGLFDLFDDGSFDWRYEKYGWQAQA